MAMRIPLAVIKSSRRRTGSSTSCSDSLMCSQLGFSHSGTLFFLSDAFQSTLQLL
jgi:hypothetical protein